VLLKNWRRFWTNDEPESRSDMLFSHSAPRPQRSDQ
jgi:hypothetical protein